jgi:hypothetical protein
VVEALVGRGDVLSDSMLSTCRAPGLMLRDVDVVEAFARRGGVPSDSMLSASRDAGLMV